MAWLAIVASIRARPRAWAHRLAARRLRRLGSAEAAPFAPEQDARLADLTCEAFLQLAVRWRMNEYLAPLPRRAATGG